jgi:hypothetical protein
MKSLPRMLIVGIVVAIVAVAAVAGAYVLLSNGGGTSGGTNQNNDSGNNGQNDNNNSAFQLKNGEFMLYTTTTTSTVMDYNGTMRWEVSNVTATGYDIEINFTSGEDSMNYSAHGSYSDTLGVSGMDADFDKGVKIGLETLSTPFGDKKVEHWRATNTTDDITTVIDFYIGAQSPVMYKMVATTTGVVDPIYNGVSTMVLNDTNIDDVKTGNACC